MHGQTFFLFQSSYPIRVLNIPVAAVQNLEACRDYNQAGSHRINTLSAFFFEGLATAFKRKE